MLLYDFVVCILLWVDENAVLDFGIVFVWLLHEGTVAGTGFLAQASMPRLGETSPSFFARTVAQATRLHFERGMISLRREGARLSKNPQEPLFHYSSSRLGEKGLAW